MRIRHSRLASRQHPGDSGKDRDLGANGRRIGLQPARLDETLACPRNLLLPDHKVFVAIAVVGHVRVAPLRARPSGHPLAAQRPPIRCKALGADVVVARPVVPDDDEVLVPLAVVGHRRVAFRFWIGLVADDEPAADPLAATRCLDRPAKDQRSSNRHGQDEQSKHGTELSIPLLHWCTSLSPRSFSSSRFIACKRTHSHSARPEPLPPGRNAYRD
jgi:hypothetical protein